MFFVALQQWYYWKDHERLFSKQTDLSRFSWDKLTQVRTLSISVAESFMSSTEISNKFFVNNVPSFGPGNSNHQGNSGFKSFKAQRTQLSFFKNNAW